MIILKIKGMILVTKFQVNFKAIDNITSNINNITISYEEEIKNLYDLINKIDKKDLSDEFKNYIEDIIKQKKQFESFSKEIKKINDKLKEENNNYLKANEKAIDLAEKC